MFGKLQKSEKLIIKISISEIYNLTEIDEAVIKTFVVWGWTFVVWDFFKTTKV